MTDEEKAEEYANGIEYCDKVHNEISGGYTILYDKDQLIEAVMYGLAESKPKWHDLRKDPNDLPKLENKHFSWSTTVTNQDGIACHYNYDKHCWETPFVTEIEGVTFWCELPKFED